MEGSKYNPVSGNLVISDEVIATIAVTATKDIDGVSGLLSHPKNIQNVLKMGDGDLKYVDVVSTEADVKIQMNLEIKNGVRIPAVASEVQSAVKSAVQSMTGKVVSRVDINIASIVFENEPEQSND